MGETNKSGHAHPDACEVIADHLVAARYDKLSATTVAAAKAGILDTIGCALAGTSNAEIAAMGGLVAHWAGKPLSTLIGRGGLKVSPEQATLVNAATVHQYDFDDVHDIAPCHPSSSSVLPALALAEAKGGVDGKTFITAVALGNDLTSRVSLAIPGNVHDYPWFRAPVVGIFGAAAASAYVVGANRAQTLNTFGLTLPSVGGTWASLQHPGSNVRSLRDGLSYRNAVLAAELAMRGIQGERDVFEGPYGFFHAFFNGHYDRERFIGTLGREYETDRVSLKPWPSIRHLHTTLTAVLDVMVKHDLKFGDVKNVNVHVGRTNRNRCQPVQPGAIPAMRMDLLGNLPFAVANAIRHRHVPLQVYRDSAMADEVIIHALPKVSWEYDPTMDGEITFERGLVDITTAAGAVLRGACTVARGNPDNPMSEAERHAKFRLCAAAAAKPPSEARIREIIAAVDGLESMADVSALAALLA